MKKMGLFVLAIGVLFIGSAGLGDTTTKDMVPVLEKVKTEILVTLTAINKDMTDAAKKLAVIDHKSNEVRNIVSELFKGRPYVNDCSIVSKDGKIVIVEPTIWKDYEGRDISIEPQVKEVLKTKSPLVSKVVLCLDGKSRIDFEYPIINDKGEFAGSISLLINHDVLFKNIIEPLVKGEPCKVWVMQTDGLVIYDPDPNQINRNIFSDPLFEPFKDLIAFSKTVAEKPSGAGEYDFYKKGLEDQTVVKKDAVWETAGLYGSEWRIVAMEIAE